MLSPAALPRGPLPCGLSVLAALAQCPRAAAACPSSGVARGGCVIPARAPARPVIPPCPPVGGPPPPCPPPRWGGGSVGVGCRGRY